MADNDNMTPDQDQNPFEHPIKRNNWWLYIFGGMVMAGIIIWFFIDWSYKDRNRSDQPQQEQAIYNEPEVAPEQNDSLPAITVEGVEGGESTDSIQPAVN